MSGKVKHFQELEGRYYTRVTIPEQLRTVFDGKRQLREPLGDSRKQALRDHPAVVAKFLDQLDQARRALAPAEQPAQAQVERPMSLSQFAKWIYSFRPMLDREARNSWRAYNMMGVDDIYRDHLKEIA